MQILHRRRVVPATRRQRAIKGVGLFERPFVDFDAQPRPLRHPHFAAPDQGRLDGQRLPVLPDPMRVERGDGSRRRGADLGEHRQRHVEMIVRVRPPGQPPAGAELRHFDRAMQRPEMRVGQRNVDTAQHHGVLELPPIRRDHVGRRADARGATELRHHLAPRIALLRPARILGIGEVLLDRAADRHCLIERPGAVWIERYAGARKLPRQRRDGLGLLNPAQHAALELEIAEAVTRLRRLGLPHDGLGIERREVAHPLPVVARCRRAVPERRPRTVADIEQVAQHRHGVAHLP